jgi:triosephosphate isomerase (TIM)
MSRVPFVAGNWKMHKTRGEAVAFVKALVPRLPAGVDAAVCAPFTALADAVHAADGTPLAVYAQNMHEQPSGAFTGEVSAPMLVDVGADGVLLGHSERRQYFGETDQALRAKLAAAHEAGLRVILAVGEREPEREVGETEAVLRRQLEATIGRIGAEQAAATTVAYEPVWAIGTGRTATPEIAEQAHAFIRGVIRELHGDQVAEALRIQYGGSMKPGNAAGLLAQPDVDGGLIGGASLDVDDLAALLQAAAG